MKIVLSRKGFDSQFGGYPSPVMSDGRLISLPIPSLTDLTRYSDLMVDKDLTYFDLMKQLQNDIRLGSQKFELTNATCCHCDPDIRYPAKPRAIGWLGAFGQIGAPQTHLTHNRVDIGDIFLFFGWFRQTMWKKEKLSFDPASPSLHVLFGYLQISKRLQLTSNSKVPDWLSTHPHVMGKRRQNPTNTIYIAADKLSWNNSLAGAGIFNFHKDLVLTKGGCCRSKWALPSFFKDVQITYHSKESWKADYFQSASRGQEFVISENTQIQRWATKLIDTYACR